MIYRTGCATSRHKHPPPEREGTREREREREREKEGRTEKMERESERGEGVGRCASDSREPLQVCSELCCSAPKLDRDSGNRDNKLLFVGRFLAGHGEHTLTVTDTLRPCPCFQSFFSLPPSIIGCVFQ